MYDDDHNYNDDDDDDDDTRMTVMADGGDWRVRLVDSSLRHALQPMPLNCTALNFDVLCIALPPMPLHCRSALHCTVLPLFLIHCVLLPSNLCHCTVHCTPPYGTVQFTALHFELHSSGVHSVVRCNAQHSNILRPSALNALKLQRTKNAPKRQ